MPTARDNLLSPSLLERIEGLSLIARRVAEGAIHGLHRSPLQGLSTEFVQHREYSPGDEIKRLDWRVLGRSDRYVIRQYEEETNLRAVILLDGSRSMAYAGRSTLASGRATVVNVSLDGTAKIEANRSGEGLSPNSGSGPAGSRSHTERPVGNRSHTERPAGSRSHTELETGSKFHYARVLAAALGHLLLQQGDSVGLAVVTDRIVRQVAPRSAPGHIMSLCQVLTETHPEGETDLPGVLRQLASRLKRRTLLLLISDLLDEPDGLLSALGQLHHRGHEVVALQVLDPRELSFDLGLGSRGVTVIRDMETGQEFETEPVLVRDHVRAEVGRWLDRLQAGARLHGFDLVRCRTDEPAERVLTRYLHARLRRRGRRPG